MKTRALIATLGLIAAAHATVLAQPGQEGRPAQRQQAPAFKARKLTRADFDALVAQPGRVLVLDVRRPDELTSIGGFPVYMSVQAADLEQHLNWLPRDRQYITVSNHAARAGRAADLLTARGFAVAGAIGAQDYEGEGGTLVKIGPPPPRAGAGGTAK
jgi:rhodanese-related sulfurtransferase